MMVAHFDADVCIMTKFFALISGKWKPIILYLIENEVNRFNLMQSHMPAISKKILTEQLRELETDGLILREEVKAKVPKIVVYHLTDKGSSLRRLIDNIIAWCTTHMKEDIPEELIPVFGKTYADLVREK